MWLATPGGAVLMKRVQLEWVRLRALMYTFRRVPERVRPNCDRSEVKTISHQRRVKVRVKYRAHNEGGVGGTPLAILIRRAGRACSGVLCGVDRHVIDEDSLGSTNAPLPPAGMVNPSQTQSGREAIEEVGCHDVSGPDGALGGSWTVSRAPGWMRFHEQILVELHAVC